MFEYVFRYVIVGEQGGERLWIRAESVVISRTNATVRHRPSSVESRSPPKGQYNTRSTTLQPRTWPDILPDIPTMGTLRIRHP